MSGIKHRRYWLKSGIGLLLLATLLRLALPVGVKLTVNRKLGTAGKVGGIGFSLWRGAYQLQDLQFSSTDNARSAPIFRSTNIDIGIRWPALLHGKVLATVKFFEPEVNLFTDMKAKKGVLRVEPDWTGPVMGLVPIQIDRLEVSNGQVHFRDPGNSPDLDVSVTDIDLNADHLSDRGPSDGGFTSSVTVTGKVMKSGKFECYARITPFAKNPTFESSTKVVGLELRELNPFLSRYFGFAVSAGSVTINAEWKAAAGRYKGYVQPVIMNLKVIKPRENPSFEKSLKMAAVGIVGWFFKKPENMRNAEKLNYEGAFSNPNINLWQATIFLYANSFVRALPSN